MRYGWILAGVCLLSTIKFLSVKTLLYHAFLKLLIPRHISYIEVNELSAMASRPDIIILDTRSREEYNVSHIYGAKWVGYEEFKLDQIRHIPKDVGIVLYCSVGYRSNQIGKKLKEAGYRDVKNLYGGIFEWVNQGHTVYADGKNTKDIHPYSSTWGFWLSEGNKVNPD